MDAQAARAAGGLAHEAAWQAGVDPAAVGSAAHGYAILGYARDPARLSADVAAYRSALGESGRLRVTLRPGADLACSSAGRRLEDWRAKGRLGSFWGVCCLAACMASS